MYNRNVRGKLQTARNMILAREHFARHEYTYECMRPNSFSISLSSVKKSSAEHVLGIKFSSGKEALKIFS